ncbi:hypothetical protein P691DRAFT_791189 [Macrolepiota fuliginosa MF-IS2]|uniref:Uncharacterized protein n=1 Tax=Macrolepiota fuliginosa MF-IS2 TaxID=1400762 RepID=A0A9P5XE90_9AGAR|nr:hypothetical protein P691DRAFT_791189 [Macrolepiota fuliginosa MF-IS2]
MTASSAWHGIWLTRRSPEWKIESGHTYPPPKAVEASGFMAGNPRGESGNPCQMGKEWSPEWPVRHRVEVAMQKRIWKPGTTLFMPTQTGPLNYNLLQMISSMYNLRRKKATYQHPPVQDKLIAEAPAKTLSVFGSDGSSALASPRAVIRSFHDTSIPFVMVQPKNVPSASLGPGPVLVWHSGSAAAAAYAVCIVTSCREFGAAWGPRK